MARDVCIVAPLYAAFAFEATRTGERLLPPLGLALVALAVFASLVVLQTLRAPNVLSGAIGLRVWLAYVPMLAVGYCFVRTSADFETLMKVSALLGLLPASLACAEWAYAVVQGDFGPFERLYGAWELTETQRFVVFTTGEGNLRIPRVPATFTGVTQYFGFSLVAFAAGLAMSLRRGGWWWLCAAFLATGALASGARASYVAVPVMALASLVTLRGTQRGPNAFAAAAALYLAVAAIAGTFFAGVAQEVPSHLVTSLHTAWSELSSAFTIAGHGTGWDTNAALRYGNVEDRRYIENWYAKAMLELGVIGLAAVIGAFAIIVGMALRRLRSLDDDSRVLAAPVCALLLVTIALLFKGPYIDLDPLNVYFWLLTGALFGLFEPAQGRGGAA
jgi:hypothetical protein